MIDKRAAHIAKGHLRLAEDRLTAAIREPHLDEHVKVAIAQIAKAVALLPKIRGQEASS